MAIRIKNRWHQSARNRPTRKTLEDHAGALAFIAWRLALEHAKELHREGFDYASDRERIAVISEYCAFEVQVLDRLIFDRLEEAERELLINALGHRLAEQMQDNLTDLAGAGNYRAPFIALLNERLADYAGFAFDAGLPGYACRRYLGRAVLDAMGENQTNRWVIDQVMEISAPEIVDKLAASVDNLLGR